MLHYFLETTVYKAPDGVCLSGIGLMMRGGYGLPRFLMTKVKHGRQWVVSITMVQDEDTGRGRDKPCRQNAFAFNLECWETLMGHFEPDKLNLNWLFERALLRLDSSVSISRGEHIYTVSQLNSSVADMRDCTVNDSPMHIKELTIDDLNHSGQDIPTSHDEAFGLSRNTCSYQNMKDCFKQPPLEIREEIASNLPTDDFLNYDMRPDQWQYYLRAIHSGKSGSSCVANKDSFMISFH